MHVAGIAAQKQHAAAAPSPEAAGLAPVRRWGMPREMVRYPGRYSAGRAAGEELMIGRKTLCGPAKTFDRDAVRPPLLIPSNTLPPNMYIESRE